MKDNVIYNDKDECLGYVDDLIRLYKNMVKTALDVENYEEVENLAKEMQEIEKYKDYEGLLVLSENNGMGFTCKKYKEGERSMA